MCESIQNQEILRLRRELDQRDQIIAAQAERIMLLEKQNQPLAIQVENLTQQVSELKELLKDMANKKDSKKPKFPLNYSQSRQEQKRNQKNKRKKKSTGRKSKDTKRDLVGRSESIYPHGIKKKGCQQVREQFVWRLEKGKAIYVRYRIFAEKDSRDPPPLPPGVRNSRTEYGIEIHIILAFLIYHIGVSMDHAIAILSFFTELSLSKSQADSLLYQLTDDWQKEFQTICEMIALATVVYIDETGWKIDKKNCYTWIFTTVEHVVYLCGKGRGADVLDEILPKDFAGIGVTDNYAAYNNRFTKHQKCWAHLLRKIISLMLRFPEKTEYRKFYEQLSGIYYEAVRYRNDKRLSVSRASRAELLQQQLQNICRRAGDKLSDEMSNDEQDFIRLHNELIGCLENLFVFVEYPEVEATNNVSERNGRKESQARKAARTSKTERGAKRRSVIATVFGSLMRSLENCTLGKMFTELVSWSETGISLFHRQLQSQLANAPPLVREY